MRQFWSKIVYNKRICADFCEMALSWDAEARDPGPGQFLTARVSPDTAPLLRRPFAFAGFDGATRIAYIIYQVRGRGTEILSEKRDGEKIDVIGPLGNEFPLENGLKKAVAVAGGIGLGPILFLVNRLRKSGIDAEFVFGCKNELYIPDVADFRDAKPHICTDNGKAGFKGNVVQYIDTNIKIDGATAVFGCGPVVMLENLYKHAQKSGAAVWVSMEAVMACGAGACMGCVVPAESGYLRVCKEGPVFNGGDMLWELM